MGYREPSPNLSKTDIKGLSIINASQGTGAFGQVLDLVRNYTTSSIVVKDPATLREDLHLSLLFFSEDVWISQHPYHAFIDHRGLLANVYTVYSLINAPLKIFLLVLEA